MKFYQPKQIEIKSMDGDLQNLLPFLAKTEWLIYSSYLFKFQ